MIHDAAGIVGSMVHDAAGIVGSMIHDAAGIGGRGAAYDGWAKATPLHLPGMNRLWDLATNVTSSGDGAHVVPKRPDPPPTDLHNVSNAHRFPEPWGGSTGVWPWPTRTVVDRQPPDPRRVVDQQPRDPCRVANHDGPARREGA